MTPACQMFISSVFGWGKIKMIRVWFPFLLTKGFVGKGGLRRTKRNGTALRILVLLSGRLECIWVESVNYDSKPTREGCLAA